MNILLLSNYSIGCVPFYVKRAIDKLGHSVFPFGPDHDGDGWTRCTTDIDVNEVIDRIGKHVDLVLCVEASTGTKFFPRGLAEVKAPTAWWGIDNHLNYRWHKEYGNLFDVAFFAQKDYLVKAQQYGTGNVHWLPLGCDEGIHSDKKLERIYDVSFVGNLTPNRKKFFASIGTPVNLVSGAYLDEMAIVYSQSKIVLNISAREDLNMRAFEAMCAGALLVTQRIDAGIRDLFEEGKHFVFHDIYNAGNVVRHYLTHAEERETIARAGKEKVIGENTYGIRVEHVLSTVRNLTSYREARKQKYSSYKICVQESLVYSHRSFGLYDKAKKSLHQSMNHSIILTSVYLLRFLIYRLFERFGKIFEKNF